MLSQHVLPSIDKPASDLESNDLTHHIDGFGIARSYARVPQKGLCSHLRAMLFYVKSLVYLIINGGPVQWTLMHSAGFWRMSVQLPSASENSLDYPQPL